MRGAACLLAAWLLWPALAPAEPDMRARAEAFGKAVEQARDRRADVAALQALRTEGDALHADFREGVRALEAATGEDEARLEALYRSGQWHDVNYALAAVRYWQAWTDLSIAALARDAQTRLPALSRAERGFQASALRILFPGLVYGSWLGLAYVESARGDAAAAERRLQRLAEALAADPGNPLAPVVESELAVMRARRGEVQDALPGAGEPLTPALARRLEEEAFALLEQRRTRQAGAAGAGERLQRLAEAGYLDDRLVARMLAYRDELAGREMGDTGLLLDAEYAYANRQYETALLKYRAFERAGGFDGGFDPAPFRYRLAASLYERRDFRAAAEAAATVSAHPSVGPEARKLRFLALRELQRAQPGAGQDRLLAEAARAFLAGAPADPDAGLAHLALAATGGDGAEAHLQSARADPRLRGAADRAALERATADFHAAIRRGDPAVQAAAARQALALIGELPRAARTEPALQALALQMRTGAGERGEGIAADLAAARERLGQDESLAAVLAWCELRALDGAAAREAARRIAREGRESERRELVARALELERGQQHAELEALLAPVLPAFEAQPDTHRALALARLRALAAQDRGADARALADGLLQRYPDSGDVWLAWAEAAERSGDAFGAARGWARIAAGTPTGSDRWIEATLRAVALDDARGREENCRSLADAAAWRDRMDATARGRLAALSADNGCGEAR